MDVRKAKSKKDFDANSISSKQHDDITLFLDRNLGRVEVANALRGLGYRVELHDDHFSHDTPDTEWLIEVGRRNWVVLGCDKKLRHNFLELVAIIRGNVRAFILTSGSWTGTSAAKALVAAMNDIVEIVRRKPAPLVASVSLSGDVSIKETAGQLQTTVQRKGEQTKLSSISKPSEKSPGEVLRRTLTTPPPESGQSKGPAK